MNKIKRVGVLTGGGDCPGLNAVLRAVVRRASFEGIEVVGILDGFRGLVENRTSVLTWDRVADIVDKGGTIIGTSRSNPFKTEEGAAQAMENYRRLKLDALLAIGGDDTLGAAYKLSDQGLKVVGIPKTIDNDLQCTDYTFGFDSAVNIAVECIDRLRSTAESHHRVMIVEVMGRNTGWIALFSGLAAGADVILIPEENIDVNTICEKVKTRFQDGGRSSLIVVAEGVRFKQGDVVVQEEHLDEFGHVRLGGVGQVLAEFIQKKTGIETRSVTPGHILRGGMPTAFDRVLATRFGIKAVEMLINNEFGKMVGIRGNDLVTCDIGEVVRNVKKVDENLYNSTLSLFG